MRSGCVAVLRISVVSSIPKLRAALLQHELQSRLTLVLLQIPHGKFVRLHAGTWHAGPLFDAADEMVKLRYTAYLRCKSAAIFS